PTRHLYRKGLRKQRLIQERRLRNRRQGLRRRKGIEAQRVRLGLCGRFGLHGLRLAADWPIDEPASWQEGDRSRASKVPWSAADRALATAQSRLCRAIELFVQLEVYPGPHHLLLSESAPTAHLHLF